MATDHWEGLPDNCLERKIETFDEEERKEYKALFNG